MLTQALFTATVEAAVSGMRAIVDDYPASGDALVPTLMLLDETGRMSIVGVALDDEVQVSAAMLRGALKAAGVGVPPVAAVFVAEVVGINARGSYDVAFVYSSWPAADVRGVRHWLVDRSRRPGSRLDGTAALTLDAALLAPLDELLARG